MNMKMFNYLFIYFEGTRAETWPMRQRLADAARRHPQFHQVAFADGRVGTFHVERAAHHPHWIPVSFHFHPLVGSYRFIGFVKTIQLREHT